MKSIWNSFKVAFAMFSKIPMPRADWTEENMRYMFCWLPFVGTVIGALSIGIFKAGQYFNFRHDFLSAILVLVPVAVTGGIHIDGLLDTADALSSWQERKRRLEILKDTHTGAFAVITACVYFLAWYGAYSQIGENAKAIYVMGCGFMVSRCFAGMSVLSLPKAKADGTVAEFSRNSSHRPVKRVLFVMLAVLLAIMVWIDPGCGAAAFVAAGLVFLYSRHMIMKYFGGMTGDLAGYSICLSEIGMALVLAVVSNFTGV